MFRDTRSPLSLPRRIGFFLLSIGIDLRKMLRSVRSIPHFISTFILFKRRAIHTPRVKLSPILGEHLESAGSISDDYFALDLWAARQTYLLKPIRHLDVGSRLDGYVAHVLTWNVLDVLDIRPLESTVYGMTFVQDDARYCSNIPSNSYDLVSSLHAIEHFGLGRYGDEVDPDGPAKAIDSLVRVVKPDGFLLLGFPSGNGEVLFNAQRLLDVHSVLESIPGKVLEVVITDGTGSTTKVDSLDDIGYNCVGILIQMAKSPLGP